MQVIPSSGQDYSAITKIDTYIKKKGEKQNQHWKQQKEITSIFFFQVIKETEYKFRKLCKYSKPIVQYITHNDKNEIQYCVSVEILRVLEWPPVATAVKLRPSLNLEFFLFIFFFFFFFFQGGKEREGWGGGYLSS